MFYHTLRTTSPDDPGILWKQRCVDRLALLRQGLREHIHGTDGSDRDESRWLRLATWNIREFDSNKFGSRLPESHYYIAEIIAHFDVVAVQEVREDLKALDAVMRILGPDWRYVATDVTEGTPGNRERMAFVYNRQRVRFGNVAGEISLPKGKRIDYPHEERLKVSKGFDLLMPDGSALSQPGATETYTYRGQEKLKEDLVLDLPDEAAVTLPRGTRLVVPAKTNVTREPDGKILLTGDALEESLKKANLKLPKGSIIGDSLQFARSPFLVEFQSGWLRFILCTVHIFYGKGDPGLARRNAEIRRLTAFLAKRALSETDSDANNFFFVLGDFNIVGKDHTTWDSLHTNGFAVPAALKEIPAGSNVARDKAYDQIAYWTDPDNIRAAKGGVTAIDVGRAGIFDFFTAVFRSDDEATYTPFLRAQQEERRRDLEARGEEPGDDWTFKDWRTYQMSDHLPMWLELRIDFADDYLNALSRT